MTLIVAVAIALPISIGGTGTREAGFVVALAPLGIGTEAAVALGISFGVVLALVGLVGAPLSSLQSPSTPRVILCPLDMPAHDLSQGEHGSLVVDEPAAAWAA